MSVEGMLESTEHWEGILISRIVAGQALGQQAEGAFYANISK